MAASYLETRINACGRVYGVIAHDRAEGRFTAGWLELGENAVREAGSLTCDQRSDAIEFAAAAAVDFIRGTVGA